MIYKNPIASLLLLSCLLPAVASAQFIVAHRGASFDAPENTIAAFELAWQQKADAIEADFYLTKDSHIVCMHDKSTRRTAPEQADLTIANSTIEQLSKHDVGKWKDNKYAGQHIPTLQQVLATVPAAKKIFVEVKCGPEIVPVMKPILEQSGLKHDQITIICFNESVVKAARAQLPEYRCNWLTGYKQDKATGAWTPTPDTVLSTLKKTGATGLGSNGNRDLVTIDLAKSVASSGCEFHVWTINEPADAVHFAQLGAQSITTDRPALIRQALESIKK